MATLRHVCLSFTLVSIFIRCPPLRASSLSVIVTLCVLAELLLSFSGGVSSVGVCPRPCVTLYLSPPLPPALFPCHVAFLRHTGSPRVALWSYVVSSPSLEAYVWLCLCVRVCLRLH